MCDICGGNICIVVPVKEKRKQSCSSLALGGLGDARSYGQEYIHLIQSIDSMVNLFQNHLHGHTQE